MNYELAKQLKDAGFPQTAKPNSDQTFSFENGGDGGSYYIVCPAENGCCFIQFFTAQNYAKTIEFVPPEGFKAPEILKIPTLSELIAAVPLSALNHNYITDGTAEWQAQEWEAVEWEAVEITQDGPARKSFGATPEEAVANLWLALNGKPLPVIS